MNSAKEKMFWLRLVAVSLLFCAPTIASGIDVLTLKTRAELSAENGQGDSGKSPLGPAIHAEKYDPSHELASESSVAPKGGLIGSADNIFGSGRQMLDDIPVTLQKNSDNTCVGSCMDMLLPNRSLSNIESHALRPGGLTPSSMVAFLDDNFAAAGLRTMRGSFEDAIASGNRFIAIVDKGHAVVIDGIRHLEGVPHVIVRDPAVGAYLERLDWFLDQRLIRNTDGLGQPTIWGAK